MTELLSDVMVHGGSQAVPPPVLHAAAKESIHSGHFMVSNFEPDVEEEVEKLNVPILDEQSSVEDENIVGEIAQQESPGSVQRVSIDGSLTKLFNTLTIAYNQQITNPRWNMFKGMKLNMKDKIRLNNVIWRCWHIQFVKRVTQSVCRFASPTDDQTHTPLAVVLEGKYWKRKPEAVIAEYKKWRTFNKHRALRQRSGGALGAVSALPTADWMGARSIGGLTDDLDMMDFSTDSLMDMLMQQPYTFPNPREIARVGVADFIQPGLVQLQPNLDDDFMMDTLEPLQDWLCSRLPTLEEEPTPPRMLQTPSVLPPPALTPLLPRSPSAPHQHALLTSRLQGVESAPPLVVSPTSLTILSPPPAPSLPGALLKRVRPRIDSHSGGVCRVSSVHPILPATDRRRNSMTEIQLSREAGAMTRSSSDSSGIAAAIRRRAAQRSPPPCPSRPAVLTQLLTTGVTDEPRVAEYRQHRRASHINCEQKRRGTIKGGFDRLYSLVPALREQSGSKISKAAMLHMEADYIRELRAERNKLQEETTDLRKRIESLHAEISHCQSMLPATGAPVTRAKQSMMHEMFDKYVQQRTLQNWKFYLFSKLLPPLVESYSSGVSTSSLAELRRTVLAWQEQSCALVQLRPRATAALCELSRSTSVLADPSRLPIESVNAVTRLRSRTPPAQRR